MSNIPNEVNEVLKEYFSLLETKLPVFLEAYYIYRSISLGAFCYGASDIDFLAVTKTKVTEENINILKEIHNTIKQKFPKTDLMGLYVVKEDLLDGYENEETCLSFIDGVYQGLMKFDKNSIDAFQLQKYGITIKGQDIKAYDYTIDWDILINNMKINLNTYWLNWLNDCKKPLSKRYISLFFSLETIEWVVLGVTRLYYTFREKDITSKVGAGEYALQVLPERWHKIINEAMRLRKGEKKSYYSSIIQRRKNALEYIEFLIEESNNFIDKMV